MSKGTGPTFEAPADSLVIIARDAIGVIDSEVQALHGELLTLSNVLGQLHRGIGSGHLDNVHDVAAFLEVAHAFAERLSETGFDKVVGRVMSLERTLREGTA